MFKCVPNCGECCGVVPIEAQVYNGAKSLICQPVITEMEIEDGYVVPITDTGTCAFLNGDKSCAIYFNRPQVCRDYGIIVKLPCHRLTPDGTLRTRAERRRIRKLIDKDTNSKLRSILHG